MAIKTTPIVQEALFNVLPFIPHLSETTPRVEKATAGHSCDLITLEANDGTVCAITLRNYADRLAVTFRVKKADDEDNGTRTFDMERITRGDLALALLIAIKSIEDCGLTLFNAEDNRIAA